VNVLLLTVVLVALAMLAMSLGVLLSGRSLRGSCGGSDCQCRAAGKPEGSCDRATLPASAPGSNHGSRVSEVLLTGRRDTRT
jgi:hypothetical protein